MAETQTSEQQNSNGSVPIWLIIVIILMVACFAVAMALLYKRPSTSSALPADLPTQVAVAEAPSIKLSATSGPQGPTATPTWTPRPTNTPYITPTFVNTAVPPETNTRVSGSFGGNKVIISGGSGAAVIVPTITKVVPRSTQTAIAVTATAAYSATREAATATQIAGTATAIAGQATPIPNNWRGAYYANQTFSGTPALIRNDAEINFNWGAGSPAPNIPNDHFSVQWDRNITLDSATYFFYAYSDDGVRVYLDDILIIDAWQGTSNRVYYAFVSAGAGTHTMHVDYYENEGDAQIQVSWQIRNESAWIGEYYRNKDLDGAPYFIRQDNAISFDWGSGGPNGLNQSSDYSIRWLNIYDFNSGLYNFTAKSDDGVRVYVDNTILINEWHNNDTSQTYQNSINLSGEHLVTVEYYKGTGNGSIDLNIAEQPTDIGSPPTKP